ncbi:hypothetical protein Jann_1539 [Jannaschia sp. CCS1]|nr:hypothetical protein Jann_1539 [Jannaschia sp. CCS1]
MRSTKALSVVFVCLASVAAADSPFVVGTATGEVFYRPVDTDPIFSGEQIEISGAENTIGSYVLSGGEVNTLTFGSSGPGIENSPDVGVARRPGSIGTFTVTGEGTEFNMLGADEGMVIQIGRRGGVGTFNVLDGAFLSLNSPTNVAPINAVSIQLGQEGGTGTLNVDDGTVNIQSTRDAFLFLGGNIIGSELPGGDATANFLNGSSLNIIANAPIIPLVDDISEASIVLGQTAGASAEMIVDASDILVRGEAGYAGLSVGREEDSSGTFELRNGASVLLEANTLGVSAPGSYTGAFFDIGRDDGANGQATISSSSTLTMTSEVDGAFIGVGRGEGGFGRLTVEDGGSITYASPSNDGFMEIGQNDPNAANGGVGIMTVTGAGSVVDFDGEISVGNEIGTGSSTGLLTVANGGQLSAGTINLWDGGFLLGNGGTISGNVFAHAGSFIAPGASPGVMTIDGNLSMLTGSTLELEFAGPQVGQFDVLSVLGDLTADGPFNLVFSFLDGYQPGEIEAFDILNVAGSFQSNFFDLARIDFLGLNNASVDLSFGPNGTLSARFSDVAPIPLPASFWMLVVSLGTLRIVQRRRFLSTAQPKA